MRSEGSDRSDRSHRDNWSERLSRGSRRDEPQTPQGRSRGRQSYFFLCLNNTIIVLTFYVLPQILSLLHAPIGKKTTVVITPSGTLSGSLLLLLHLHLHLTESRIAQIAAIGVAETVRGGTGKHNSTCSYDCLTFFTLISNASLHSIKGTHWCSQLFLQISQRSLPWWHASPHTVVQVQWVGQWQEAPGLHSSIISRQRYISLYAVSFADLKISVVQVWMSYSDSSSGKKDNGEGGIFFDKEEEKEQWEDDQKVS